MHAPKTGDTILCAICNRARLVMGNETGWQHAVIKCKQCDWKHVSQNQGKAELQKLAHKHADTRGHRMVIEHDGYESKIRPIVDKQIPLIDDLLLP